MEPQELSDSLWFCHSVRALCLCLALSAAHRYLIHRFILDRVCLPYLQCSQNCIVGKIPVDLCISHGDRKVSTTALCEPHISEDWKAVPLCVKITPRLSAADSCSCFQSPDRENTTRRQNSMQKKKWREYGGQTKRGRL